MNHSRRSSQVSRTGERDAEEKSSLTLERKGARATKFPAKAREARGAGLLGGSDGCPGDWGSPLSILARARLFWGVPGDP